MGSLNRVQLTPSTLGSHYRDYVVTEIKSRSEWFGRGSESDPFNVIFHGSDNTV